MHTSALMGHLRLIRNLHNNDSIFDVQNTKVMQMQSASATNATWVNRVKLNERKSDYVKILGNWKAERDGGR